MSLISNITVFALSFNVIIFLNLPAASYGREVEGYDEQTLKEVLTPSESVNFILFNQLPPRVYYDERRKVYFVKGHKTKSDNGNLVAQPRWQYLLGKVTPGLPGLPSMSGSPGSPDSPDSPDSPSSGVMDRLRKGYDALSTMKSYYTNPAGSGDAADQGGAGDEKDGGKGSDGGAGDEKDGGKGSDGGAGDEKDGGKGSDGGAGNEKDGGKGENADADGDGYGQYADYAMSVLTSDLGQLAFKTGVSFVPGGSAALKAYETGTKAYKAYNDMSKATNKIPGV